MIRSLLIALDGSPSGDAACVVGLCWAGRHDALAVGCGIVDEPGILVTEPAVFEESLKRPITARQMDSERKRVQEVLDVFAERCAQASVACRTVELAGTPWSQLIDEAQRHDLILLGRETQFDAGSRGRVDGTLVRVIKDGPRPVVVVPLRPGAGEAVVVAYDGSLQAARAVYSFEASGLGHGRNVHVVSVVPAGTSEAARHAARAAAFLRARGIETICEVVTSKQRPADIVLQRVESLDAGLLVMGAYGQPGLREFFLGSLTRAALAQSPVPIFLAH
jgi:nucleotide-binding universal stress UspA family protein